MSGGGYGGKGSLFYGNFWGEFSLGLHRGELSSVVGLDQYRHRFAGGFGHGGQDIHMISWS
jgi:hypothetical protein